MQIAIGSKWVHNKTESPVTVVGQETDRCLVETDNGARFWLDTLKLAARYYHEVPVDAKGSTRSRNETFSDELEAARLVADIPLHVWTADAASLAADMLSDLGYRFDGQSWVAPTPTPLHRPPRADDFSIVRGCCTITGLREDVMHLDRIIGELDEPSATGIPTLSKPVQGYEMLADVLDRAYHQAASGKGSQRHAEGSEPFDEQVMQDMARRFGVGSLLGQAFKKSHESQRLPLGRAVHELLGAINYLAGAVIRREADEGSAA